MCANLGLNTHIVPANFGLDAHNPYDYTYYLVKDKKRYVHCAMHIVHIRFPFVNVHIIHVKLSELQFTLPAPTAPR